jgi:hypothetical protein
MITREEILMGRDKAYPLSTQQHENLDVLLERLNRFRQMFGKPMRVSSGYRPHAINAKVGGAMNSAHLHCQAADFYDTDKAIRKFILEHPSVLEECDLYCEDFVYTPTWVHLQSRPTRSGKRMFKP